MTRKPTEEDIAFGAMLKRARDDAGLSTERLASELYLQRESVDRYMRGRRRPERSVVERWEALCDIGDGSLGAAFDALPDRGRTRAEGGGTPEAAAEPVAPPEPVEPPDAHRRPTRALRAVASAGVLILVVASGFLAGNSGGAGSSRTPHPDPVFAATLSAIRARLDVVRVAQRRKLAADGAKGQAAAARSVRAAFAAAARRLGALAVASPERTVTRRMLACLRRARDGYGAMATAAHDGSSRAFAKAADDIAHAEDALRMAMASLRKLGYELVRVAI